MSPATQNIRYSTIALEMLRLLEQIIKCDCEKASDALELKALDVPFEFYPVDIEGTIDSLSQRILAPVASYIGHLIGIDSGGLHPLAKRKLLIGRPSLDEYRGNVEVVWDHDRQIGLAIELDHPPITRCILRYKVVEG